MRRDDETFFPQPPMMPPNRSKVLRIAVALACALSIGCGQTSRAAPDRTASASDTGQIPRERASASERGGSIAGKIAHPAHVVPAMRICAIGSGAPQQARRVCVRTKRDQTTYRIDGLPADEYIVIAQTESGPAQYRIGGHMQQVQCIRAPCPAMPASVTVSEKAHVDGVDLNDFYDAREDFPALTP
jgi:hypothetical protein